MFSRLIAIVFCICSVPHIFALEATYYADVFEGKRTANGSIFSQTYHSAALCGVDLGQYAYVRYGSTGAVVTLNDRPNCSQKNSGIDLSKQAFSYFGDTRQGRLNGVTVTPIGQNIGNFPKKIMSSDVFANLGVKLFTPIASTYFAGDSILIEGKNLDAKNNIYIFIENKITGKKSQELVLVNNSGIFSTVFSLPKDAGDYYFSLVSSTFSGSFAPEIIRLIDPKTLTYPNITQTTPIFQGYNPKISLSSERSFLKLPYSVWGMLDIVQGSKSDSFQGTAFNFSGVSLSPGNADFIMKGYLLSSPSSLDRSQDIGILFTGSVLLDYIHTSIGRDKVILRQMPQSIVFRFRVPLDEMIKSKYYVTLPSGDVLEYIFPKSVQTEQGNLIPGVWVTGSFPANERGTYMFEVNTSQGIAYINIPIPQGKNIWNILPRFSHQALSDVRTALVVKKETFNRINLLRTSLGRRPLVMDDTLSKIAQLKVYDMYDRNYVEHINPDGMDIQAFARSKGLSTQSLGENIAYISNRSVSDIFLQDGLEESPGHRANMIHPRWTKVGIGYLLKNKKMYLVQVFSE